jgi:hypothetical protein
MISDYSTCNEYGEADADNCYLRYRRCQASTLIRRSHALIAEGCAEHLYITRSIAKLSCDDLEYPNRLSMVHGLPTGLLARVVLSSDDRNLITSTDIHTVKETILAPYCNQQDRSPCSYLNSRRQSGMHNKLSNFGPASSFC